MAVTITAKDVHDIDIAGLTIAIFVTFTRLGIRIRNRKLGWDDFWAAFSIIGAILLMTGVLIILDPKPSMTQLTLVAGYYITSEGFYTIVWTSRLSILCTIIRISPPGSLRRILYGVGVLFGIMWTFLAMQEIVICEREPGWKEAIPTQCHLGKSVAISQLTTDIIADLCLLIAPLRMFWNSMLPTGHRVRLNIVFSTCALTTVVSLVHAYWIFANLGLNEIFTGIFETTISMIVASLNVIVGLLYHACANMKESSTMPSERTAGATGIELHSRGVATGPIAVDITTTTYTDAEIGVFKVPEAHQGGYEGNEVYDKKQEVMEFRGY
ncbi:hypothetical protein GGU11DRAFT_698990 [Lentinula aff. detonsa]|uniref:Rhodopsin domain-containing protein n=1 Tax=Lentinula aff. detonsa TaxID=2804958 RepID=A0AA38KQF5_9AGAR|nr:hypothetical protein GGU10DRAFT_310938 [Lentinula aff. detonsa]KAJ3801108.1 hypothetical protein GGU11DRAFT_698990 [Lentinula aff. detonsa]